MYAIVVEEHGGPEQLEYKEVPEPTPGPGQVLLKMSATSVNFADVKMRRSLYRNKKPPFTPGFDGVGTIEALGEGVRGLHVGQRVAAYVKSGSYAEKAIALQELCYPIDESISDENGIGIGVMITAYNALTRAGNLKMGEDVLIHAGAGGIGSTAIQIARVLGAKRIFTTVGSTSKERLAKQLGADEVILYEEEDFAERIQDVTDGRGVDLILDTIGGKVFEKGLDCLADFGRLVIFGHSSSEAGMGSSKPLHRHNRSIIGYSSGGIRRHNPSELQSIASIVLDLVSNEKIRVFVGGAYPLKQAADAHRLVESRKSTGKIVLYP